MPMIEEIMQSAGQAGASDVHIIVGTAPRMRVNGELLTMNFPKMTEKDTLEILLGMMTQLQRERFEERGEYDMSFSIGKLGRYRVHAYKEKGFSALTLRLVSEQVPLPESLGIPESVIEICEKEKGLVLITGASGSGKSTTLASLVNKINHSREVHVVTLESPIEYVHKPGLAMISQREIGTDSGSYVSALHAAMREDTDVIFIDEMQGTDVIAAAIAAVEAGHLVFASMNTADAAAAVEHMLDAFPFSEQKQAAIRLANVLEALVTQRLSVSANGKMRSAEFEVTLADEELRRTIQERKWI